MYRIDDSLGHGRRFDGIGAISGGGVSKFSLHGFPPDWPEAEADPEGRPVVNFKNKQ